MQYKTPPRSTGLRSRLTITVLTSVSVPLCQWLHQPATATQTISPTATQTPLPGASIAQSIDTDMQVNVGTEVAPESDPAALLEQLAACAPSEASLAIPPLMEGIAVKSVVLGWDNGLCRVTNYVFEASAPEETVEMSVCLYSPATLALMTDEVAYEQARTGQYSFDSSDERDATLAAAMAQECEMNFEWFEELTSGSF